MDCNESGAHQFCRKPHLFRLRSSMHPETLQHMVLGKLWLSDSLNSREAPDDPLDLEQWTEQLQFGYNDAAVVEMEEN